LPLLPGHPRTDAFDFRARTLYAADADAMRTYYRTRIQFVHRSAYDYLFKNTNKREGRHLQIVTMMDTGKIVHRTLGALKSVLELAPMVFDGRLATHYFFGGMFDATMLATSTGVDLTPWMDDLHRHLHIWYARERRHAKLSLGVDWGIKNGFRGANSARFGYVISRWDTLMQSPHAQVFCSTLLRRNVFFRISKGRSLTGEQVEEWLLWWKRLIAVLSEKLSRRGAVAATVHVRVEHMFRPNTISWDAMGLVNEATVKVFADLLRIAAHLFALPNTLQERVLHTEFFTLRSYNVYLGVEPESKNLGRDYLSPLQIQTDWACRRRLEQSDICIRILCLAKNATTFGYHWVQDRNGEILSKQYGEDVVSLFDTRAESLEALQNADEAPEQNFPRFQGTQQDFSTCLDQILSMIRADEQGQLDAWQQLYTLACLKAYFKDFWTIQTSETQWLAQITL
jgi:hypothetical protein